MSKTPFPSPIQDLHLRRSPGLLALIGFALCWLATFPVLADDSAQTLPFSLDWSATGLISVDDDWSAVPGIIGYRGDNLTGASGTDARTVLADGASTPVDVNANESSPNGFSQGGVTEFELTNPVVALAGSNSADAPHLVVHLDTTGDSGIWVSFLARDLEDGGDNAQQQIALHYRVGASGNYTDVPAAYLSDATVGNATQETFVCVQLPAAADNQPDLRLRVLTTNAAGSDEWVGIDDLTVDTSSCVPAAGLAGDAAAEGDTGTSQLTFTLTLTDPAPPGGVTFDIATADGTATVADGDYVAASLVGETISAGNTTYDFLVTINGDSDPEDDETFTVTASNFGGITSNDLSAEGTIVNDDATPRTISEIQGSGSASPFDGQDVQIDDVVVTVVGPQGFFIQTAPGMEDGDPNTSEGLYVYTGSAPGVSVSDEVTVVGEVDEFFGFTEITNGPIVTVTGSGTLPAPVVFDQTTPSPDPNAPSCAIEFECYEGMLISVPSGFVNAGNLTFGSDPLAEVPVSAGGARVRREPGLAFPGGQPGSSPTAPIWDGNPELFELDADKLGLPFAEINGGSTFTATGALGYEFNDYELWPSTLTVTPAPLPRPVDISEGRSDGRPPLDFVATIGSLNFFRLFDDVDDPPDMNSQGEVRNDEVRTTQQWNTHRIKLARHILEVLAAPMVLGVQEVESLTVLQALAAEITSLDAGVVYSAHLIEGNDVGTIDVGFLVRSPVSVTQVTQLAKEETFVHGTMSPDLTHDRPPLLLEAEVAISRGNAFQFAVLVLHNRSLSGIDSEARVRTKRLEQAQSIAQIVQDFQTTNPLIPLVVLGDLNAFEFTDGWVDVVGQIVGTIDSTQNSLFGPDLVDPDLEIATLWLPPEERYSFEFRATAQALDHALLSTEAALRFVDLDYGRGNVDAPEVLFDDDTTALRASDHDGFVLGLASEAFRIFRDGFESGDTSEWSSSIP